MSTLPFSLAASGAAIVGKLGGRWHDDKGMCLCPAHADRTPSLSVRVGERSLLFKCFAGCETLEILRALRSLHLVVPVEDGSSVSARRLDDDGMRLRATTLWETATSLAGTPGECYLAGRGLGIGLRSLRFHPRTPLGRGRDVRFLPAIIAAIAERSRIMAVQRLFLEPDGSVLCQDIGRPKRTLGRPLSGAVRLAAAGPTLGLAEGIETAGAAMQLLGIPVWATLGSERFHQIAIPQVVDHLILLPDADRAGRIGAARAQEQYANRPFRNSVEWPWGGLNDWNDVLMRPGPKEGREREIAARRAA